jgi:hypothetical protein
MSPTVICCEPSCSRPATSKGRCDIHRRKLERERSRDRRGSTRTRDQLVEARDRGEREWDRRHPRGEG